MFNSKMQSCLFISLALVFSHVSAVPLEEFKEHYANTQKGNQDILQGLDDEVIGVLIQMDVFQNRLSDFSALVGAESIHYDSTLGEQDDEIVTTIKKPLAFTATYKYYDYDRVYSARKEADPPKVRVEISVYEDLDETYDVCMNVKREMDSFMNAPSGAKKRRYKDGRLKRYFEGFPFDEARREKEAQLMQARDEAYVKYHEARKAAEELAKSNGGQVEYPPEEDFDIYDEKDEYDMEDEDVEPSNLYANLRGPAHYSDIYQPTYEITWLKGTVSSKNIYFAVRILGHFDYYLNVTPAKEIMEAHGLEVSNAFTLQLNNLAKMIEVMEWFGKFNLQVRDWSTYTFGVQVKSPTRWRIMVLNSLSFSDNTHQLAYLKNKGSKEEQDYQEDLKAAEEIENDQKKQVFEAWDLIKGYYEANSMKTSIKRVDKDDGPIRMDKVGSNVCANTYFLIENVMQTLNIEDPSTYISFEDFFKIPGGDLNNNTKYDGAWRIVNRLMI